MKEPRDVIEGRRRNIDRFRRTLEVDPYRGYDVLIVSSSTEDEARYQQDLLDRAFCRVASPNAALDHRVLILSVVDPTEGGQVIGHVYTWKQALARAGQLGVDLKALLERREVKVAVYHNGGKGERASPLTQGLGNSRGTQRLVGTICAPGGLELEQELLLSVVLQTSSLARTSDGGSIDTYWTSQILFDAQDPEDAPRTGAPLEKLVVRVDREKVSPRQLHDFGTALMRRDGIVRTFYRNKIFGRRNRRGEWDFVEERRGDWDQPDSELGFDFGSFRMRTELHLALADFYDLPDLWEKVAREKRLEKTDARDIDPHVIQPLVALLRGIARTSHLPAGIPAPRELRERALGLERERRRRAIDDAVQLLRSAIPKAALGALEEAGEEASWEMLAFYLLHRDRPFFADPERVVGTIRFDSRSYWLTYRRPIDIGNEKFLMLSDLTGHVQELQPDGSLNRNLADEEARTLAQDVRRMRGIPESEIARFHVVGGGDVTLGREELARGVAVHGVSIKGSAIRGECRLLPGSRIVDSVLNHVGGKINAEGCYLESVTVAELVARRSIVHKLVEPGVYEADGAIVSDAFREGLQDDGFPPGQVRMRAAVGYDPQEKVSGPGGRKVPRDEVERTAGGRYTFAEVRSWPSRRGRNDAIESKLRAEILRRLL